MNPMLDIIVTHYNEPWSICEKYFTMLRLQHGADFSKIRVIIIHDGVKPFPKRYFKHLPYRVEQHRIDHGGISAARNEGIRLSKAEWIMFCDIDDMFSNIYALRDLLTVLPAPNFDLIWSRFISEDVHKDGTMVLHERKKRNVVFIHGKMFRREFIVKNDVWFDSDLTFNEDSLFCSTLETLFDPNRVGQLNSLMIPYVWCFRNGSLTSTAENRDEALEGSWIRNKKLCEIHRKNLSEDRYNGQVARTIWDAYYTMNSDNHTPKMEEMRADFREWYKTHKGCMEKADPELMKQIHRISKLEHDTGDNEGEARWEGWKGFPCKKEIPISEWLKGMEQDV